VSRRGQKWWVVIAMAPPVFILTADINGVTVALPDIGDDLDASTSGLQWVLNAYLLAFAAFLVPVGRLGDLFGRRLVLMSGTAVFAAASAAGGLAPTEEVLIAARAVQGVGAAMFFATSLSIVSAAFPAADRPKGIGIWTAVGAVGAAAGPILAGVLTDTLGWRWFFFVNIPISVLGIVMALVFTEESRDPSASRRIDWAGFATVTLGLLGVIYAVQTFTPGDAASAEFIGPLVGGLVALGLFALVELRLREPLIDLRLFKGRDYLSGTAVGALQAWCFFGIAFVVTIYLQDILRLSAIETGLMFVALCGPFAAGSAFMGEITKVLSLKAAMAIGMAMNAIASLILIFVGTDVTTSLAIVTVAFLIFGVGASIAYNLSTTAGMIAVDDAKAGAASGILSAARFVGGAFGVAVAGAVLNTLESSRIRDDAPAEGLDAAQQAEADQIVEGSQTAVERLSELPRPVAARIEDVSDEAFLAGLAVSMAVTAVIGALGVAAALFHRVPRGETGASEAEERP